ncbi:coaW [Acrasis kona]|uniref:CoaW n=1 Tax=Acrasis kona TaxID=1008807 RepID=A0AAW2Z7B3_9EUKA
MQLNERDNNISIQLLLIEKRKALKNKERLLGELYKIIEDNKYVEHLIKEEKHKSRDAVKTLGDAKKQTIMLMYTLRREIHKQKSIKKDTAENNCQI